MMYKPAFNADELGVAMHLFCERKTRMMKSLKSFIIWDRFILLVRENAKEISMVNGTAAVELEYVLEVPVRDDIYDYIVNG